MNNKIAIVGMSGMFPEATDLNEFYTNLLNKVDSVQEPTVERLIHSSADPTKKYKVAGHLERVDLFDHKFFGISKKEAEFMEPSQRLALQLCCEAIENAGYGLKDLENSDTALYLTTNSYTPVQYRNRITESHLEQDPTIHTGNLSSMVYGRIAYCLKLQGPAVMIDTGCSSSLIAIDQACEKLLNNRAGAALVGGINLKINFFYAGDTKGHLGASSPQGKTRAFDADADGIGVGEGGGMLFLKRYEDAVRDNDNIHAVILGTGITQDGGRSNSIAAPSPAAQTKAITKAWDIAGIEPQSISYVEAHGAGTPLGDMIEFQALTDAFQVQTNNKGFCGLSAVKSNIGHLGNLAGMAGVIKAILSLKNKMLLPTINFDNINPYINEDESAAYVLREAKKWEENEYPRRCGVSCFGLSGTNAHLVLEEAPERIQETVEEETYLLKVSAKSKKALKKYLNDISDFLKDETRDFGTCIATLNRGRGDYSYRIGLNSDNREDLLSQIASAIDNFDQLNLPKTLKDKKAILLLSDLDVDKLEAYKPIVKALGDFEGSLLQNKNTLTVLIQYGLYLWLKSKGVDILTVIATGTGKLTSKVVNGKMSLEDALDLAKNGDISSDPINEEALKGIVQKLSDTNDIVFFETSMSGISEKILSWPTQDKKHEVFNVNTVDFNLTEVIRNLYQIGVSFDWNEYYAKQDFLKIEAPTYPFEQTRCWFEEPVDLSSTRINNSLYTVGWTKKSLDQVGEFDERTYLVIQNESGFGSEILGEINSRGGTGILVNWGSDFEVVNDNELSVDLRDEDQVNSFRSYLEEIEVAGVISLLGCTDSTRLSIENYPQHSEKYFFDQYQIAKVFKEQLSGGSFELYFITTVANKVLGSESLSELNHIVGTLAKNLTVDFPLSTIGHIDIGLSKKDEDLHAKNIVNEVLSEDTIKVVSYRNANRYVPVLSNIEFTNELNSEFNFEPSGNYLITGGASGIGLEVCKTLSQQGNVNLIILGRSALPERTEWERALKKKHLFSENIRTRITALLELEQSGAKLEYYGVDMADSQALEVVLVEVSNKYQKINGIIHSAGMGNKGASLGEITEDYFGRVFGPKITGTLALDNLVRSHNPDFFVSFSSIGTVVPSKNSVAYSCGNAFLDAFASNRSDKNSTKYLTINWSDWAETGLVFRKNLKRTDDEKASRSEILDALSNEEGIKAINVSLTLDFSQVIVVKADLSGFKINPFFEIELEEGQDIQYESSELISNETNLYDSSELISDDFTETQKTVVRIWNRVLKLEEIDLDDDFYEIGGHSLNMTQMLGLVEKEFGVNVPIEELLENSTVRKLANRVDELKETNTTEVDEVHPAKSKRYYALSHAQKRFWLLHQTNNKEAYNVPCVFKLNGSVEVDVLNNAFIQLIERHEGLRTSFTVNLGEPVQQILESGSIEFNLRYEDEVDFPEALVTSFLSEPFDLERPPLLKVLLIRVSSEQYIFAMTIPHIIADGKSVFVLRNELLQLYKSLLEGTKPELEPIELQYKDFAEWQSEKIGSGYYDEAKSYWFDRLANSDVNLNLPYDVIESDDFKAGQVEYVFSDDQKEALQTIAKKNGTTLFVVILSAFKILLSKISENQDISIGSPVSGRTAQFDQQIGVFLNTVIFRTSIDETQTFISLLNQVKKNTMKDMNYAYYPYDLLVTQLSKETKSSNTDLFDVGFTWNRKEKIEAVNTVSFDIESYPFDLFKAKKDLWLLVSESDDLWVDFVYRSALFKEETIQILVERFRVLIDQVIANQTMEIASYDLSIDAELGLNQYESKASFDLNFLD